MRQFLIALIGVSVLVTSGCSIEAINDFEPEVENLTYQEILATGIKPAISPDYDFPNDYQFYNGCFAFAVNNVLDHKYDSKIDLLEAEKKVNKPRKVLWDARYIKAFLNEYDLEMRYAQDAWTFFRLLELGEPVVMQYPIEVEGKYWIGHIVAAYSFDDEGIWVSDTLSGNHIKLSFDEVFTSSGKSARYGFATVEFKE